MTGDNAVHIKLAADGTPTMYDQHGNSLGPIGSSSGSMLFPLVGDFHPDMTNPPEVAPFATTYTGDGSIVTAQPQGWILTVTGGADSVVVRVPDPTNSRYARYAVPGSRLAIKVGALPAANEIARLSVFGGTSSAQISYLSAVANAPDPASLYVAISAPDGATTLVPFDPTWMYWAMRWSVDGSTLILEASADAVIWTTLLIGPWPADAQLVDVVLTFAGDVGAETWEVLDFNPIEAVV